MAYKQKQATIKSVMVVKEGTSDKGRDWTLFKVEDTEGIKYSTFNARYTLLIGQSISITYEEKEVKSKDGVKTFINRNIVEPNGARTPSPKAAIPPNYEEMITLLRLIPANVQALLMDKEIPPGGTPF